MTVLYLLSCYGFFPSPWNLILTTSVGLAIMIPKAPVVRAAKILVKMEIGPW